MLSEIKATQFNLGLFIQTHGQFCEGQTIVHHPKLMALIASLREEFEAVFRRNPHVLKEAELNCPPSRLVGLLIQYIYQLLAAKKLIDPPPPDGR